MGTRLNEMDYNKCESNLTINNLNSTINESISEELTIITHALNKYCPVYELIKIIYQYYCEPLTFYFIKDRLTLCEAKVYERSAIFKPLSKFESSIYGIQRFNQWILLDYSCEDFDYTDYFSQCKVEYNLINRHTRHIHYKEGMEGVECYGMDPRGELIGLIRHEGFYNLLKICEGEKVTCQDLFHVYLPTRQGIYLIQPKSGPNFKQFGSSIYFFDYAKQQVLKLGVDILEPIAKAVIKQDNDESVVLLLITQDGIYEYESLGNYLRYFKREMPMDFKEANYIWHIDTLYMILPRDNKTHILSWKAPFNKNKWITLTTMALGSICHICQ